MLNRLRSAPSGLIVAPVPDDVGDAGSPSADLKLRIGLGSAWRFAFDGRVVMLCRIRLLGAKVKLLHIC